MTQGHAGPAQEHPLWLALQPLLDEQRPILAHLNEDTAWLLLLPCPRSASAMANGAPAAASRCDYFRLLIDPWFTGHQVEYFRWFSAQSHRVSSCVETINELDAILRLINSDDDQLDSSDTPATPQTAHGIDAVAVSHEFTDHCHRETLEQLPRDIPVIAGSPAADRTIRSWNYFDPALVCLATADSQSFPNLPPWLEVSVLGSYFIDVPSPGYHAAVLFKFPSPEHISEHGAQAIIYSPHGLFTQTFREVGFPHDLDVLALLHGTDEVYLLFGLIPLNLGACTGRVIQQATRARYWLSTHQEDKIGEGIVARTLTRVKRSFLEPAGSAAQLDNVKTRHLASGECIVLS